MPTIYTEDPVGKAIEEHYYGTMGVQTGSVPNNIGYDEYVRRSAQTPSSATGTATVGGGRSSEPLAITAFLLGLIPRWLCWVFAVVGACAFLYLGANMGVLDPVRFAELRPGFVDVAVAALVGIAGGVTGFYAMHVCVMLFDIALRLVVGALGLGLVAGGIWLAVEMLGGT